MCAEFDLFDNPDRIYVSTKVDRHERDTGNKMTTTLTTNDIATVVCECVNIKTGKTIEPAFEAYGYEKFQEFVQFYKTSLFEDTIVWVRGYGYQNGERVCLATEFIGVPA
jgi:hypothetical protein